MTITKQLYQLQELDQALDSSIKALEEISSQIGESGVILKAKDELASELKRLEEVKKEQHAAEWETDDLKAKIAAGEESLYSGRITSPKELASLKQEVDSFRFRCGQLEDRTLELMEQVEATEAGISGLKTRLEVLEAEWHLEQKRLISEVEKLKATIAEFEDKRELLLSEIDSSAVSIYQDLKRQRGKAVAKVEQGICTGCRISLSVSELQRARSSSLIQCSSCGRILFLA